MDTGVGVGGGGGVEGGGGGSAVEGLAGEGAYKRGKIVAAEDTPFSCSTGR